jgi:phenylacetate-CoA ligase
VLRATRRLLARGVAARRYRKSPGEYAALQRLRAQQWLTTAELEGIQRVKLERLVQHAYAHVPYYRQVMHDRGIRPEHVRSATDLTLLPLLTKSIIREHLLELRAERGIDQPQLVRENHTGGSTGVPLSFYQDAAYSTWAGADLLRNYEMCGYCTGDPIAYLWGSDYDAQLHRTLSGKIRDALNNRVFLDAFDSTEADFVKYARLLATVRPKLLVGYVSSLVLLARVVEAHGVRGVRPAAIQSSAEVLTPAQRQLLEETFGCRVFDRYGCREVGNIAHECDRHGGLHILADNNLVELARDGCRVEPGEDGDLIVTNLNNLAMPFIRYDIGDSGRASAEACACGRGLPLLAAVTGRSADIIVAPSGKLLHGEFFTHLFYKIPSVSEFQVVQRTPTRLDVNLVPGPGFDQGQVVALLTTLIRDHADPRFAAEFFVLDRIPRSASGKLRFTMSDVPLTLTRKN